MRKTYTILFGLMLMGMGQIFADTPDWVASSEWAIALGRFHPMILHLPIGCFAAVFVLELIAYFKKPEHHLAIVVIWILTATSALLASALGWLLSADGYGEGAVDRHENSALIFTGLTWICLLIRLKSFKSPQAMGWKFRGLVLLTSAVMGFAGHEGGNLTHGENYLFEKLPENLRVMFIPENKNSRSDVPVVSAPGEMSAVDILQDRCISCHGEKKQKGDYRLDAREHALVAGESEETPIVPGDAMTSFLVRLITLDQDDDEVMPPAKKKPLSSDEIVKIIQWIDAGANWP